MKKIGFLFWVFFPFCLFFLLALKFYEFTGNYEDFLKYRVKGNIVYLDIFVDKIYYRIQSKKINQKLDFRDFTKIYSDFNYSDFYQLINHYQKNITSGFWTKLYINFITRNKIYIYANFTISDKTVPDLLKYVDKLHIQSFLSLDKQCNIEFIELKGKNEWIDLFLRSDRYLAKGKFSFFVNKLRFGDLDINDFKVDINFNTFPSLDFNYYCTTSGVNYKIDDFSLFFHHVFFKDGLFIKKVEIFRNREKMLTFTDLNLLFEFINNSSFFSGSLISFSKLVDIRLLDNNVILKDLDTKFNFYFSGSEKNFVLFLDHLKFRNSKNLDFLLKLIDLDYIDLDYFDKNNFYIGKIGNNLARLKIGFWNNLVSKIMNVKGAINSKYISRIFFSFDFKDSDFWIIWNGLFIRLNSRSVDLGSRDLWVSLGSLQNFTVFSTRDVVDLFILDTGKIFYFSALQNFYVSFDRFWQVFWTDYRSWVFLNKNNNINFAVNIFCDSIILNRLYSFLNDDSFRNSFFRNSFFSGGLDFLKFLVGYDSFQAYGVLNLQNKKLTLVFGNGFIFSFFEIYNLVFNFKVDNFIDRLYYNGFIIFNKDVFYFYRDFYQSFLCGIFNDMFFYYKPDFNKLNDLYQILSYIRKRDIYSILNKVEYFYDLLIDNLEFSFFKDDKNWVFIDSRNILFRYRNIFIRSYKYKRFHMFYSVDNQFLLNFSFILDENILFNFKGIYSNSGFSIEYDLIKKINFRDIVNIIFSKRIDSLNFYSLLDLLNDFELMVNGFYRGKLVLSISKDINFNAFINISEFEILGFFKLFDSYFQGKQNKKIDYIIDILKDRYVRSIYCKINFNFSRDYIKVIIDKIKLEINYFVNFNIDVLGEFGLNLSNLSNLSRIIDNTRLVINFYGLGEKMFANMLFFYNVDYSELKLSINYELINLLNLFEFLSFSNLFDSLDRISNEVMNFSLKMDKGDLFVNLNLNLLISEIKFRGYLVKDVDLKLLGNLVYNDFNFKNISNIFKELKKVILNFNFLCSYYIKVKDIYRLSFQELNIVLVNDHALINGKLDFSLKELIKVLDLDSKLSISNQYLQRYVDQIISTGIFEIKLTNLRIEKFSDFIEHFKLSDFSDIDIINSIDLRLNFVLEGYSYLAIFYPIFNNGYRNWEIIFYEGFEKLAKVFVEDKIIKNISIFKLPSIWSDYSGNLQAYLDFYQKNFVFDFDKFKFNLLSNDVLVDGKMIITRSEFLPPHVRLNQSEVKIGFDGNIITVITSLNKLDIGIFNYLGKNKVSLVIINNNFKKIEIYGNLELKGGLLSYKKYQFIDKKSLPIVLNMSIFFDSVRFKNNFVDIIFSGKLRYSDKLSGNLSSKRGFIVFIDGIYRILEANLSFDNNLGDLYSVLQRIGTTPLDYKIKIIKGNLLNMNLSEFGIREFDSQQKNFENYLYWGIYNVGLADLVSISYLGYTVQREIFPNLFLSYFNTYEDRFSKLGYRWYYSLDWIISRFKLGLLTINFRSYSNGRNNIGIIFIKGF